jgi:uncharacterized lipoprotein YddW (UPF0748 family)
MLSVFQPRKAYAYYETKLKGICVHGEDLANEGIEKSLTKIASYGYNAIFFLVKTPEGKVYFKSKQLPLYMDIFGDVVREAHKKNIKVYAYFPVIMDKNYASKYPKEKMVNIGNTSNDYYVSLLSDNYIKYLKDFIGELLNYDVDGILLDYIRFPNGSYDFSDTFNKLVQSSGINLPKIKDLAYKTFVKPSDWKTLFVSYEQGDSDVVKWVNLRESVVRSVSSVLTNYAKSIKPSISVGAFTVSRGYRYQTIASAPKISGSLAYQVVNFAQYPTVFKGVLDFMAPMVYLSDLEESSDYAEVVSKTIKSLNGNDFPVYVTVNPDSITLSEMMKELYYAYKNAEGVVLFRYPLFTMGTVYPDQLMPEVGKTSNVKILCSDGKNITAKFTFGESYFIPLTQKAVLLSPFFDYYNIVLTIGSKHYSVNGTSLEMDVAPFISDSRTFVPVRFIGEALGFSVSWDGSKKEVKIAGNSNIVLIIGSKHYSVNGTSLEMDVAPFISDSRTFVPVHFIGEALGFSVSWDGSKNSVTIKAFKQID